MLKHNGVTVGQSSDQAHSTSELRTLDTHVKRVSRRSNENRVRRFLPAEMLKGWVKINP
jgi:hypothetical protein